MSRPRAGYIGFNRIPAASALNSAASGVWTVREAESLNRAGTWPIALIPLLNVDGLSGALAAVSIRRLNAAYSGPCMRVRRSSDNTEQDIGFSGNYCDEAAITSFVGGGNGFVVTWYDQSGNGNNAGAVSFANAIRFQPRVVTSGTLMTRGGRVAIDFTRNYLNTTAPSDVNLNPTGFHISSLSLSATSWMACGVIYADPLVWSLAYTFPYGRVLSAGTAGVNDYDNTESFTTIAATAGNSDYPNSYRTFVNNATVGSGASISSGSRYVVTSYKVGGTIYAGVNDTVGSGSATGTLSATRLAISIANNWGEADRSYFGGQMQEVVFWPSDKSSQVAAIRQNINEFLAVY
jgi:hypothetical protein